MEISVYIIGRNCSRTLGQALDSVYSQTRSVDEVVYLDDGSSDSSLIVAERYLEQGLVVLRHETSLGIPAARNHAVRSCRGSWIAVLDADDQWHREKIAQQSAYLELHPETGLLGSYATVIDDHCVPMGTITAPLEDDAIKRNELMRNCFVHSSVMFRRDLFDLVGGYADLPAAQDYDLMLKLSEHTCVANLPLPLVDYRISHDATSVRKRRSQRVCTQQARDDACRRRRIGFNLRLALTASLHRLFLMLVLFNPGIHWGLHQMILGDPGRGRELLRRAASAGLRSRIMAALLLMIPDAGYRIASRLHFDH